VEAVAEQSRIDCLFPICNSWKGGHYCLLMRKVGRDPLRQVILGIGKNSVTCYY